MSEQLYGSSEVSEAAAVDQDDKAKRPLKKGSQFVTCALCYLHQMMSV